MAWYTNSRNYLLARFTDRSGNLVTDTNPTGTSVAVTLTDPGGVVRVNAQAMTWDGAFVATDLADGKSKTGWWKYLAPATAWPKRGTYHQKCVGSVSGTQTREMNADLPVKDKG